MKRKQLQVGFARLSADIPLLADGKPPTEFRIFRAGENTSDYGSVMFDAEAAEMVLAADKAKGNPLYFDWNHGMAKKGASRFEAASAGTFKLAIRDGELWAVDCAWTEDGAEDIAKRRYNLFSPAFEYESDAKGVRRVSRLVNCALVNLAGLDNLQSIAAAAALSQGEEDMESKELQAALDKANANIATLTAEIATLKAKDSGRGALALGAVLGLASDVTDETRVDAVKGLVKTRGELLTLTAQASEAAAVGVLMSWKESHGKFAALSAQMVADKAAERTKEFNARLDKAVTEKKIAPSFRKDFWEAKHVTNGVASEEGFEMLGAFLKDAQPLTLAAIAQPATGILSTAVGSALSRTMNIDESAFTKWQAEKAVSNA